MTRPAVNTLYILLVLSFTISSFSEGIILPIYAIFVQKVIGGTIFDAGFAMGIFLITEGLFTIVVHRTAWSRSHGLQLMILGWLVWVAGICTYLLISNVGILYIAQVLMAIGNAVANPIFEQQLAAHTDQGLEQFEWGLFEGTKVVADGSAAIVGGAIAALSGFRMLIYVMIATATTSFIVILLYAHKLRSINRSAV